MKIVKNMRLGRYSLLGLSEWYYFKRFFDCPRILFDFVTRAASDSVAGAIMALNEMARHAASDDQRRVRGFDQLTTHSLVKKAIGYTPPTKSGFPIFKNLDRNVIGYPLRAIHSFKRRQCKHKSAWTRCIWGARIETP